MKEDIDAGDDVAAVDNDNNEDDDKEMQETFA